MYAGVTNPVSSGSPSNPDSSTTFVAGRGYADFISKVDDLMEKTARTTSNSIVVLFAVAWLDRIRPGAMEALRKNSRLPVVAFSATETAAIFREDQTTFLCPITGCARLVDVDILPDGSAAIKEYQSPFTLHMCAFLESRVRRVVRHDGVGDDLDHHDAVRREQAQ